MQLFLIDLGRYGVGGDDVEFDVVVCCVGFEEGVDVVGEFGEFGVGVCQFDGVGIEFGDVE